MKYQILTVITVAMLAIGLAFMGWGIANLSNDARGNETRQSAQAEQSASLADTESQAATPTAAQDTGTAMPTKVPLQTTQEPSVAVSAPAVTATPSITAKPKPQQTATPKPTLKPIPPASDQIKAPMQGVEVTTYFCKTNGFIWDFGNAESQRGYLSGIDSASLRPSEARYYLFKGYFYAPQDGEYSVCITSGDALLVELGDWCIIESLSGGKQEGTLYLNKGYHEFSAHAFGKVNISQAEVKNNGKSSPLSDYLFVEGDFTPDIEDITLLMQDNNGLVCDISLTKRGKQYSALVPPGIDLKSAVLSFEGNGKVQVGDKAVLSGQTGADLSKIRTVTVASGKESVNITVSLRQLDTGLPCVGITSSAPINSKENYVDSYFAICGNGASYGADLPLTACGAKVRGAYSSGLEKKPYSLKFENKTRILDLTPERSWILVASHLDLSQMRNYTAYEIAKSFDKTDFAPRMRFVDVFVNGEYRGLYLLGDKIDISSTRFTLNQHTTEPDVGVMLELEKDFRAEGVKGYDYFQTPQGWCVTFKDPDADELTKQQRDYIRDYFIAAEAAIISGVGYEDYIDVDSFIDWFLVETLFKNCDSEFTSSIYFHKDTGGKLKMGPVWDFDSGLGNHVGFPELLDHTGWQPRNGTYFSYLMSHRSFREKMSKRWFEMHQVVEGYNGLIDSTVELIRRSYNENFKVYDILQNGIWPVPDYVSSRKSIDGQAEFMKDWVAKRIAWLDNEFSKPNYDY